MTASTAEPLSRSVQTIPHFYHRLHFMDVRARLKKVFVQSLEVPDDAGVEKLEYRRAPAWDSVGHMRMIAALETEFGILLETEQILDLSSFNQGLEILKAHGIAD